MKTILINTICFSAAILILAWAFWSKKQREIAALNEQTRLLKLDTARLNADTARLGVEAILSNEKMAYRAAVEQWEADRAHDRAVAENNAGMTVEDTYGDKQQVAKRRRDLHQEAMKRIPDNIVLPQVQSTPYDDNLLEGLLASPINYPPADTHIVNSPFHSRPSTSDRGVLEANTESSSGRGDSSHHGSYKDHGTHSYQSHTESYSTPHSSHSDTSTTSNDTTTSDTTSSDAGSSSSSSD